MTTYGTARDRYGPFDVVFLNKILNVKATDSANEVAKTFDIPILKACELRARLVRTVTDAAERAVEAAICAAAEPLPAVSWYGFGSFFRDIGTPACAYADIDILAVCPDAAAGSEVRAALSGLCAAWPV